jgi:hypothetical protein
MIDRFHRTHRRDFLVTSTSLIAGLPLGATNVPAFGSLPASRHGYGKAKSFILFFLCGGASHIDTWDMKPNAPLDYRGPFNPIATSAPGIMLCEHLPLLAQQAHHLAVVSSVSACVPIPICRMW